MRRDRGQKKKELLIALGAYWAGTGGGEATFALQEKESKKSGVSICVESQNHLSLRGGGNLWGSGDGWGASGGYA